MGIFLLQENAEAYSVIAAKNLLSLTRDEKKSLIAHPGYISFFIRTKCVIYKIYGRNR